MCVTPTWPSIWLLTLTSRWPCLPMLMKLMYVSSRARQLQYSCLSLQVRLAPLRTVRLLRWQRPLPLCPGDLGLTTTAPSSVTPSRPGRPSFLAGKLWPPVRWVHSLAHECEWFPLYRNQTEIFWYKCCHLELRQSLFSRDWAGEVWKCQKPSLGKLEGL